jgi:hypothetical protein
MLNKNGNRLLRTLRPRARGICISPRWVGYQQFPFRAANKQTRVRAPKPPAGRRSPETRRRRARPTAEPGDCPKFSPLFPGGHFISLATPAGAHSVRPRAPIESIPLTLNRANPTTPFRPVGPRAPRGGGGRPDPPRRPIGRPRRRGGASRSRCPARPHLLRPRVSPVKVRWFAGVFSRERKPGEEGQTRWEARRMGGAPPACTVPCALFSRLNRPSGLVGSRVVMEASVTLLDWIKGAE